MSHASIICHRCSYMNIVDLAEGQWSLNCPCSQLLLVEATSAYRYVEAQCHTAKKIYRLKISSGWFTCKCCNWEFMVDTQKHYSFGEEKVFASTRTAVLVARKTEELKQIKRQIQSVKKSQQVVQQLRWDVSGCEEQLKLYSLENKEQDPINNELPEALKKNQELRESIASLRAELAGESGDDEEKKKIQQLKTRLAQVKKDLKETTTFNKEHEPQLEWCLMGIPTYLTSIVENEKKAEQLSAQIAELSACLQAISPIYALKLRDCDISEEESDYKMILKQKEEKNVVLGQWLQKALAEIESLDGDLASLKEEADEKWNEVFTLAKKEQDELKAAEEKRKENIAQRLQYVEETGRLTFPTDTTI